MAAIFTYDDRWRMKTNCSMASELAKAKAHIYAFGCLFWLLLGILSCF